MRLATWIFATLAFAATAKAHFVFLLPPIAGSNDATIIWSDTPAADPQISTEALARGTVRVLSADGTWGETQSTPGNANGIWRTVAVANETKALVAQADYGLVNRGEGFVYLVKYAAKWERTVGLGVKANLWLELQPIRTSNGIAFTVFQNGQPLPNADVSIYEPNGGKLRTVKTDDKGVTPSFAGAGQYAARVMAFDSTAGESEGRKYKGTYHYSTLVTDYRP
jgi:hypothetical protein